jgi:hypothetical protein
MLPLLLAQVLAAAAAAAPPEGTAALLAPGIVRKAQHKLQHDTERNHKLREERQNALRASKEAKDKEHEKRKEADEKAAAAHEAAKEDKEARVAARMEAKEEKEKEKVANMGRMDWASLPGESPLADLKEAAKVFLYNGHKQLDYKRFASLLKSTVVPVSEHNPVAFDMRPRMMVSEGCSGSTYALDVFKEMLEAHGTAPIEFRYNAELMKCQKNPECKGSGSSLQALGMQVAVAKAVDAGRTLVVKEQGSDPAARQAMHEMGTYAVMAYRSNVLAKMLCEAKDCFTTGRNRKLFERMGPNANACFPKRRSLPPQKQTKVWINPEDNKLVEALRDYENDKKDMEKTLSSSGYKSSDFEVVTLEDLFLSESDGSSSGLARTVRAWSTALKSLGVKPDAKIIESVLKPTRGKRPSYSIYEQISNADEVSKALAKDPKYGKKFRTLSGIVHAGEGSNSTLGFDDLTEKDGYVFIETAPEEGLDFEQASD